MKNLQAYAGAIHCQRAHGTGHAGLLVPLLPLYRRSPLLLLCFLPATPVKLAR